MEQVVKNRIDLPNGHPAFFKKDTAYQPVPLVGEVDLQLCRQGRFGLFGVYVSIVNRYGGKTRAVFHAR